MKSLLCDGAPVVPQKVIACFMFISSYSILSFVIRFEANALVVQVQC